MWIAGLIAAGFLLLIVGVGASLMVIGGSRKH